MVLGCIVAAFSPAAAFAHASDRGHVLLLPTGYYIVGGAAAVAASFLVLALLPPDFIERYWHRRLPLFRFGQSLRPIISLFSLVIFAVLLAAGIWGSRDPLSNPLPLTIWTLLWVGLALLHALLGNLWTWLNPWYGLCRVIAHLSGRSANAPLVRLPAWIGSWPACLLFFAFAWFELIYPAPEDPARLAIAAGLYWLFTFAAMLVFGHAQWSRRGEFLSVFFAMVARFSILDRSESGRLLLCWPGVKLLDAEPLRPGGVAFILLALSSVSFDGLARTFFWLGLNGINPLEFPGRTAVMGIGTVGLVDMFVLLAGIFLTAVFLGHWLAGDKTRLSQAAGLLVWSIVPIALAYHFAHYLTVFLVDGQYALVALSDPFALGWNLLGTAHWHVEAGIVAGAQSAWVLWNVQAGAIIAGHVLAVLIAHGLAFRLHGEGRHATLSQLPLTVLMIAYTVFGLWLLATPTAG